MTIISALIAAAWRSGNTTRPLTTSHGGVRTAKHGLMKGTFTTHLTLTPATSGTSGPGREVGRINRKEENMKLRELIERLSKESGDKIVPLGFTVVILIERGMQSHPEYCSSNSCR